MATFSQKLAAYICNEQLANVDGPARERARQRLAYHLGLAFRGLRSNEPDVMRAVAVARDLSDGSGHSSLIGLPYTPA